MISTMRVSANSDIPVYRQIVSQLTFMIEMGHIADGQRLPGSRLLAANLGINRNTVAHAYGELRALGLVEARGRNGMVVIGGEQAGSASAVRGRVREVLAAAVRESRDLGATPAEIEELVSALAHWRPDAALRVSFVECNLERAEYFATELSDRLGVSVEPLVLGEFDATTAHPDLALTTFFHLAEVRSLLRSAETEVVAIVAAPHIQTLMEIARVPRSRTVGLWYSTEDQAASIRDSLEQAGVTNIRVISQGTDEELEGVELVIVPSELPELRARLDGRVRVIEFGNVLDAASVRMAEEVLRDLQARRA